jgi:transcription elongation factor Elf1
MEYFFTCPHCWQEISFVLDLSEPKQSYIEDCEVCCNPVQVSFEVSEGEVIFFESQKV